MNDFFPQKFEPKTWGMHFTRQNMVYDQRGDSRDSDICTPMFTEALYTTAKWCKQSKCV